MGNIFLARVAEQAERFEDMVDFLEKVLEEKGADVTADERNLLSVAFKNLISSKRSACRTIQAYKQAMDITLPPCDPIKLGLALNFSVFYYEAQKNPKEAVALADQAL